jgi:hypothetical protein
MVLRPGDWKWRAVLLSTIVAGFLAAGAWTFFLERAAARNRLRQRALVFVDLTKAPISRAFYDYYQSGFYKFRELIGDRMRLNPDVERIRIINVTGNVVFDSRDMDSPTSTAALGSETDRQTAQPKLLEAVKRLDTSFIAEKGGEGYQIIAPYLEEWGRHEVSIVYHVRERTLAGETHRVLMDALVPALSTAGVTCFAVLALLRRVA